jgi:hypothetical protein
MTIVTIGPLIPGKDESFFSIEENIVNNKNIPRCKQRGIRE